MPAEQNMQLNHPDRERVQEVRRKRRKAAILMRRNWNDLPKDKNMAPGDSAPSFVILSVAQSQMLEKLKIEFGKAAEKMPLRNERRKLVLEVRQLLDDAAVPIDEVIRVGTIKFLVDCLRDHHDIHVHFEAISALTKIAVDSPEHAHQVVEADSVVLLVKYVYLPRANVADQAIWALGSMVSDSSRVRDLILALGTLKRMVYLAGVPDALPNHRNLAYFYYTLVRSNLNPVLMERYQRQLVAGLKLLLETTNQDNSVISDVLWTLIRLCESSSVTPSQGLLIEMRMVTRIVELLQSSEEVIVSSALRVLVLLLDEEQGEHVLSFNLVDKLRTLMKDEQQLVLQQALQFINLLLVRGAHHVKDVIQADLLPILLRYTVHPNEDISRLALTSIEHLCLLANSNQLKFIVRHDSIKIMFYLEQSLSSVNTDSLRITLAIICLLLTRATDADLNVKEIIISSPIFNKLAGHRSHNDMCVSKAAEAIVIEFFSAEAAR